MREKLLPAEAIQAVRRTEERSEVLISLFQVGFVALMSVLYFLAPKGYSGDVPIRPVPLVLVAYAPFVVLRLVLAQRRRLTPLILNISIVVDMAMISILLWAFHIQYQQDAGLYLKAPTAFYLFIFIALRGLRFDPRYVLFAGGTAALAWIVLTVLAVRDQSGMTRDFVTYMTSTQVLVGAQVDRVIAILVITAILAVGVSRAGELLHRSAEEGRARAELSRYFSPRVVTRILESQKRFQPGEGEVHDAAILTIDLRGFSTWAERVEPDQVMSSLADYQRRVLEIVLAHNGTVDKFMGDGVLCHFGAANESDRCAAEALECAQELRAEMLRWEDEQRSRGAQPFGFGMGVAGGRVVFGAVGSAERLEFTVIGTPVNTCAKLEKHTKRLGAHLLVPLRTLEAAVHQGFHSELTFRKARAQQVDGLAEPLDLAVVTPDA